MRFSKVTEHSLLFIQIILRVFQEGEEKEGTEGREGRVERFMMARTQSIMRLVIWL